MDTVLRNNQEDFEEYEDYEERKVDDANFIDHGAALRAFDKVIQWYSQSAREKDLAAKKRLSKLKQT